MTLKQSHAFPPNWDELVSTFQVDWANTVVTYGDTCYCRDPLSPDLVVHESVHVGQQGAYPGGVDAWWREYMRTPSFRFEQELEAYRKQYKFFKETLRDRNQLNRRAVFIAQCLSGNTYGRVCGFSEAMRLIKL